ncbi:hypothetical protein [Flavobacterium ajazii]|uniref:hypothetical protein n=1 Tax=Flavobacterium ajazii TaxID=2692318 RepID=UPI0013D413BF|nr:hypothetical protein [Flavobacterium ajazii]
MKYLVMISMFLFVQSDWTENVKKDVKRINAEGKLEAESEKKDNDGVIKVKKYKTKNETRVNAKFLYSKFIDLDTNYYENEKLLFAETASGIDVIIYKGEKKKEDPYAVLVEKITYFNNENEGIRKTRKLDIYENSDLKKLKSDLKKMDFKIEKLDHTEYKNVKENYERIKAIKK